jgi:hypothetical protein
MSKPSTDDDRGSAIYEDGAVFAPATVRSTRGPRLLAASVVVALGGLIAIGALDRLAARDEAPSAHDGALPPAAVVDATSEPRGSRAPTTPQERTDRFVDGPEIGPSPPPDPILSLDLRPAGSRLFVHGDVFSLAVVRVSVDLEDGGGSLVATAASIEIPGGSTAFRLGAVPRFDVQFSVPDEVMGESMWIAVTAYGQTGHELATVRQLVPRTLDAL